MDYGTAVAINPFAAMMMPFVYHSKETPNGEKMWARYLGRSEYYDKVGDCPSVMLWQGRAYQITIDKTKLASRRWTIVRIYDQKGRYLTWVPYSRDWRTFWQELEPCP